MSFVWYISSLGDDDLTVYSKEMVQQIVDQIAYETNNLYADAIRMMWASIKPKLLNAMLMFNLFPIPFKVMD